MVHNRNTFIDNIPLIGIYDNSRTSFVNLSGEKIIDGGELKFIENIGSENIGKTPVEFFQKMNNDSRA